MLSEFTNLYFPICSFVVSILVVFLFYGKKIIKNNETSIYSKLVITGLIESGLYTFICLTAHFWLKDNSNIILFQIMNKMIYSVYIIWFALMFSYFINIYLSNRKLKITPTLVYSIQFVVSLILLALIWLLKVEIFFDKTSGLSNSYGTSSNILFFGIGVYIVSMLVVAMLDLKSGKSRKYVPLYLLLFLMGITLIIRQVDPLFSIYSNVLSLTLLVMYFTIENPDLKMLEEYVRNKKLTEDSIEDKANMLFKVSQDVKVPANKIEILSNKIIESDKIAEIHNDARTVKVLSRDINNVINNVLDISDIDMRNVKPVDISYSTNNLFNQIIRLASKKMKPGIEFKYSVSSLVPKSLFGDAVKLKQVIFSIISNSIETTESGSIDLDVSAIIRYDVCRLMIMISDTGSGMSMDKINELLESSNSVDGKTLEAIEDLKVDLKIAKKIIDVLGGTLIIKSEEKRGTSFTIIINQKIDGKEEDNKTEKILPIISNKKRILLVDDDYEELDAIGKELKYNNYEVVSIMYGQDCIDKLNSEIKFEYVFLDDEMEYKNAVELIKKIDTKKYKVVVMLNSNKESIKRHYLEDYSFNDYILKEQLKSEIARIKSK